MTAAATAEAVEASGRRRSAALLSIATSVVLGFAGLVGLGLAWIQLVLPDIFAGVAPLSYGRLRPAAAHLLVFGGVLPALVAIAVHATATSGHGTATHRQAMLGGLALLAGALAGTAGILLGQAQGLAWFEAPLVTDAATGLGLLLSAGSITRSLGSSATNRPGLWFLTAAVWWAAAAVIVGNLPGMEGLNASIQNGFAAALLLGPAILGGALGAGYVVIGSLLGRPLATRMGWIGFWSLSFFAPWVGQRFFVHGPGPDWLETVAVVFSVGLFIPVLTVLGDWVMATKGTWRTLAGSVAGKFLLAGIAFVAVYPAHNLLMALRASGAVVQFTAWTEATLVIALLGVAGHLLAAAVYTERPQMSGRAWTATAGATHFWTFVAGTASLLLVMWMEGLQQGYGWIGAVNSTEIANSGDQFIASVVPLEGWLWARFSALLLAAIGGLLLLAHTVWAEIGGSTEMAAATAALADLADLEEGDSLPDAPLLSTRRLVWGTLGLLGLAAVAVWLVPSAEAAHREASLLAEARDLDLDPLREEGYEIYVQEGCWYCHTQQVRRAVPDVGLGPVSQPGDYALDPVPMLGVARIGPDIAFVGRRAPTDSVSWVVQHLVAPRDAADPEVRRPWSTMPSYEYLSNDELLALAEYVVGLE